MALFRLFDIVADVESCKVWLRDKSLLAKPGAVSICANCGHHFTEVRSRGRCDDSKLRCRRCKKECPVRACSFFAGSHLSLRVLVSLLFMFAYRAPIHFVDSMLRDSVSQKAALDWFSFFREICSRWLLDNPMKLGGAGCIVEIDDCLIKKGKRKSNGERVPGQWVFGAWDRRLGKGMMWTVDKVRSRETLLPIIKEHILPGSIIYSNDVSAYSTLAEEGYHHDAITRGRGFVTSNDFGVEVHTNTIKSWWGKIKIDMKKMRGVGAKRLPQHLDEVMYRQHRGDGDMVDYLCEDIARFYPIPSQIS